MKTGKVLRSFVARDSHEVVLRTPKWEDLVAEVDSRVVAVSEIGKRTGYEQHVRVIGKAIRSETKMMKTLVEHPREGNYIDEIIMTKLLK
jgi:hypothetical protein